MDLQRLRTFDSKVIAYVARLKEIWISEKYRRGKYLKRDAKARAKMYEELAQQARVLAVELENTELNDSELLNCREQYILAGRALVKGYETLQTADQADEYFREFSYCLDNGSTELNRLWKEQGRRR